MIAFPPIAASADDSRGTIARELIDHQSDAHRAQAVGCALQYVLGRGGHDQCNSGRSDLCGPSGPELGNGSNRAKAKRPNMKPPRCASQAIPPPDDVM